MCLSWYLARMCEYNKRFDFVTIRLPLTMSICYDEDVSAVIYNCSMFDVVAGRIEILRFRINIDG